jgi:tetratricopeptide (TPR) repeat protein
LIEGMMQRGEELFAQGRLGEAQGVFAQMLDQGRENTEVLNNLGVISYTIGRQDEAEEYFRRAVAIEGNHQEALKNLAQIFQGRGEREEAARMLVECLAAGNQEPPVLNRLGRIYVEIENFERAAACFRRSLQIEPGQKDVLDTLDRMTARVPGTEPEPGKGDFRASFSELNITPRINDESPRFLQGFAGPPRRVSSVLSPLMMQLLLLEDADGTRILFVTADLFGFDPSMVSAVREEASRFGIRAEGIFMNASHTHYAPGTLSRIAQVMGPYQDSYAQMISQAICGRLPFLDANLEECSLHLGKAEARVGVSRRRKAEGRVIFAPNHEDFYDKATPILLIGFEEGDRKVVLVNHGCHPTGLGAEDRISSDYPGYMRSTLVSRGLASGVMFLQGGLGSSKESVGKDDKIRFCDSVAGAEENGRALAGAVERGLKGDLVKVEGPAFCLKRQVALPLSPLQSMPDLNRIKGSAQVNPLIREWAEAIVKQYPRGAYPSHTPMDVHLISLGKEVTLIGLPGEPVAELARELRAMTGHADGTFISGCTNGLLGYLPTDRMIGEGGYEAESSHFVYLAPSALARGSEDAIKKGVTECLQSIAVKEEERTLAPNPVVETQATGPLVLVVTGEPDGPKQGLLKRLEARLEGMGDGKWIFLGKEFLHRHLMSGLGLSPEGGLEEPEKTLSLVIPLLKEGISILLSCPLQSEGRYRDFLQGVRREMGECIPYMIRLDSGEYEKEHAGNITFITLPESVASSDQGFCRLVSDLAGTTDAGSGLHAPAVESSAGRRIPPPVFIIGAPRSGTTLLFQLLLNHYRFSYFSNFVSKNPENPVAAAFLQHALTNGQMNLGYSSQYGVTPEPDGPSEFGEFWYRWFPRSPGVYVPAHAVDEEKLARVHREVMGISAIGMRPMLMKNTFNSMRIAPLAEAFPGASFIVCRRKQKYVAQSLLRGRMDLFGNKNAWWSLPPEEFQEIKGHYGWEQVAEQVHYIYRQIDRDRETLGHERFLDVDYAQVCEAPDRVLDMVGDFLEGVGNHVSRRDHETPQGFEESTRITINETDFRLIDEKLDSLARTEPPDKEGKGLLDRIEDFITASPQGSIFCRPWWLEAVAPGQWDYLVEYKGDNIAAMMPLVWQVNKGQRVIGLPPLTQTLGILFPEFTCKYVKMLSRQTDLMRKLIDRLPPFSMFVQNFNYNLTNWLPFMWKGFSQTTRYTYVMDDLTDLDLVFKGFRENIKTDIRKAEKQVEIVTGQDLEAFLDLNELTFKRQGRQLPYPRDFVTRLDRELGARGARRMFFARDEKDRLHAAVYLVWDSNAAYYLMSGADPELRKSGATSLLLWEAIRFASTVTRVFDFEGSVMEPIERFFRAFGGKQMPYFQITKRNQQ